jgi:ABC-type methionine transport system ATPase subunit
MPAAEAEEVPVIVRGCYRFTYPLGLLDKPILYSLIRRFDILTNIRSANVGDNGGRMIVDLEGEEAEVAAGLSWAESQGLQVTVVDGAAEIARGG